MQACLSAFSASSAAFFKSLLSEPMLVPLNMSFGPATG